ncbi:MAG: DUF1648 domain-containing protein [Syntrophomonadaceae bacterium]|jgi:uncharacterized membrane protein|nr:DUF1648 domain-containing protein [Syntrophomonadaceae bacterium]
MKVKNRKFDIVINIICLLLLLGITVYLAVNWNNIPGKVPGHYNAMGEIDRWGNKNELLIMTVIAWIIYFLMTILEGFPRIWNTGVAVTEENKERVYRILKSVLSATKLLVVATFAYLTIISSLFKELPSWFLPVFLFIILGSMIWLIVKLFKAK